MDKVLRPDEDTKNSGSLLTLVAVADPVLAELGDNETDIDYDQV